MIPTLPVARLPGPGRRFLKFLNNICPLLLSKFDPTNKFPFKKNIFPATFEQNSGIFCYLATVSKNQVSCRIPSVSHGNVPCVQEVANEFIPMNVYEGGGGVLVATGVGKRKKAIWMKEQGSVDVCNVHLHTLKDTCILL